MAAFSGTAGSVVIVGTAGTVIGGLAEWSLDGSMSPVETTAFGDTFDTFVPSVRNATGSFSGNKDHASTSQTAIQAAFLAATPVALKLYGGTAVNYWDAPVCYITGMGDTVGVKGKGEVSFSFQVSGAVTYS